VLAKSEGRQAKERAIRRRKLARLLRKLRAMRRSCPARDQLLLRIGAAKKEAGRAYGFVRISLPKDGEASLAAVSLSPWIGQATESGTEGRSLPAALESSG